MSNHSTAVLNGKIDAIACVLSKVLAQLTPMQAAQVALELAIEKESVRGESAANAPEEEIAVQEQMLGAYCELLSAVARRG